MYERLKAFLLPLLRVPEGAPDPPPGHADSEFIQTFRASPAYLKYWLLFWWIYVVGWMTGVLSVTLVVMLWLGWWGLLVVVPLVVVAVGKAAVLYVTTRLDYELRWYILTERSLRLREGVWVVRELTLTFANVQNVQVLQGPLERLFGFSNILLETAGGGAGQKQKLTHPHQAVLRGLATPAEVRDLILNLLRRYRTAGLGDADERVPGGMKSAGLSMPLLAEVRDEVRALREVVTGPAS